MRRASARDRGYTSKWEKARLAYLRDNPLCRMCEREGLVCEANVVDHIVPHRGDMKLFWDKSNWQSLCRPHHDSVKKLEEGGRVRQVVDDDGWPC